MRKEVLKILLMYKREYISGEAISVLLGVTRAAIWKCIQQLRKEGFIIKSSPNKGYQLESIPDVLDEIVLKSMLTTKKMGQKMEIHQSIDSTNNRARELALQGAEEGALVISEEQTKGRGRRGREWVSSKGAGLWMSLVLRPDMSPEEAYKITVLAAVSVVKAIEAIANIEAGIKWPNDIIVDRKKVCGILTEIQAEPDMINYIVLGIGINVNHKASHFPEALGSLATSISMATNREIDRSLLLVKVMEEFENHYMTCLNMRDFSDILRIYRCYSVTLNHPVCVSGRTEEFHGLAFDIDKDGALLVKLDDGTVRRVLSGDVSVRGIAGYI